MRSASLALGVLLAAVAPLLGGCGEPVTDERRASLPQLFAGSEEGFADALLRLRSRERRPDGTTRLEALAVHEGGVVGLQVDLGATWAEANLGDALTVLSGTLQLRSIGKESDRLLRALAAAYGVEQPSRGMRSTLTLAAFALEGDPRDLEAGPVRLKVFHEPDVYGSELTEAQVEARYAQRYAEAYLGIDLQAKTVDLAEKDQDYRAPLVRALTAE